MTRISLAFYEAGGGAGHDGHERMPRLPSMLGMLGEFEGGTLNQRLAYIRRNVPPVSASTIPTGRWRRYVWARELDEAIARVRLVDEVLIMLLVEAQLIASSSTVLHGMSIGSAGAH
jgi:hypothetical protein